jgi:hypothetical protein
MAMSQDDTIALRRKSQRTGLPTTLPGTIAIFTHPNAALLRFIIEKLNVPYFD